MNELTKVWAWFSYPKLLTDQGFGCGMVIRLRMISMFKKKEFPLSPLIKCQHTIHTRHQVHRQRRRTDRKARQEEGKRNERDMLLS
jgi:hypothetical protein